jgi:hypothetical protein
VRGALTLAGQPWPASAPAAITFAEAGKAPAIVPVYEGTYAARIFKGTSVVGYVPQSSACDTRAPCNGGILKPNVALQATGALDLDVPMVVARGAVSVNGSRMNADTYGGALTFVSSSGAKPELGDAAAASIPIAPDGSYALALLPDTYSVSYSGVANDDPVLPRTAGVIRPSVDIKSDGDLDVDAPTATVRGRVTLNGAPVATSGAGAIAFGGAAVAIRADGSYSTIVIPGGYDVGYAPSNGCPASGTFPCNAGKLQTLGVVAGNNVLDVDLKVVNVSGHLTLNGAPPPSGAKPTVTFTAPAEPATTAGAGASVALHTDASYSVRLLAGTYDVRYGGAQCTRTELPMPCNGGLLKPGVSLRSSGALDLDIASVRIRGKVTSGGKAIASASADFGDLAFTAKTSSSRAAEPLDPIGPIDYEAHLLRGRYVVTYAPLDGSCKDGATSLVPCAEVVVAGCD